MKKHKFLGKTARGLLKLNKTFIMIHCGSVDEADERTRGVIERFVRCSRKSKTAAYCWLAKEVVVTFYHCIDVSKYSYTTERKEDE